MIFFSLIVKKTSSISLVSFKFRFVFIELSISQDYLQPAQVCTTREEKEKGKGKKKVCGTFALFGIQHNKIIEGS